MVGLLDVGEVPPCSVAAVFACISMAISSKAFVEQSFMLQGPRFVDVTFTNSLSTWLCTIKSIRYCQQLQSSVS